MQGMANIGMPNARPMPEPAPLRIEGMRWRRDGDAVYETGGLSLVPGTITLLIGPNGAGKSTLLEKLAGLRPPEGIKVAYGAEELRLPGRFGGGRTRLNGKALLRYGYAGQAPEEGLFARSVREELDYSMRPYRLDEAVRESRRTEAFESVGWTTDWEKRDPYSMSGGERRRTALAAVFATPASWLLLDEPTSGLDGAGHETIARQLRSMRARGIGIVLVSHDTDWALPLADRVWLLEGPNTVRTCDRNRLLEHPDWLEQAGLRIPEWLAVAHRLRESGVSAELLWRPDGAAAAWPGGRSGEAVTEMKVRACELPEQNAYRSGVTELEGAHDGRPERSAFVVGVSKSEGAQDGRPERIAYIGEHEEKAGTEDGEGILARRSAGKSSGKSSRESSKGRSSVIPHRLRGFDPRAVWLSYVALSIGLLRLNDWIDAGVGAVIVAALLVAGRVSMRRWRGLIANFAIFSLATSAIFAWGAGSDWELRAGAFSSTLLIFCRTLVILLLGLAVSMAITPLSLRKSLEQTATVRGKVPELAKRTILTVALVVRFVPVMLELWERFAKLIRARAKSVSYMPMELARRLKDISMPFLLALFRLGDEVALALESRGVGDSKQPARSGRLKWRPKDYALVAGALVLAVGFAAFARG